jgi:hypothetical protein
MSIASDQLHARKAPGNQRAQEREPESAVFAGTHIQAQNLPLAGISLHPNGDHHRRRTHPSVMASLQVRSVQPHLRVGAFQRPASETFHLLVELLTKL